MEHEHGNKSNEHSKTSLNGSKDMHSESSLNVSGESEPTAFINESESRLFEVNNTSSSNGHPTNPFVSMDDSSSYPEVFDENYIHDYPKIRAMPSDDEADLFTPPSNSLVDLLKVNVNEDAKSTICAKDDTKPATPITSLPAHDKDSLSVSADVRNNIPKNSSPRSKTSDNCSSSSSLTYQVPNVIREQIEADVSPTFSPPMQTMDKSGGYDHARIPSSVFKSSSTTAPMEWSLCSNESLFSIHVGNTSFSTDHMFMYGDMGKTGDFTKSEELYLLSSPQPVQETQTEMNSHDEGKESAAEDIIDLNIKNGPILNINDLTSATTKDAPFVNTEYANAQKNMLPPSTSNSKSSSMSRHSDGSATSTHSFAFPILTDAEKSGPMEPTMQHSQQLDAIATSNSTWRKWFSCFSCRPCSCNSCYCGRCSCFSCC